jgi:hypothetical protein
MTTKQRLRELMLKIKVLWSDEHDALQWDDNPENLCQEFAADFDDGPLLALSKADRSVEHYTFQIFESIFTYLEHLQYYANRSGSRWVALARCKPSERDHALAALQWLGKQVMVHSTASPTPQSKAHESMDMNVLPGPFHNTAPIKLTLAGWEVEYVLTKFDALSVHMTVPYP